MPLDSIKLDDQDWASMVEKIRLRIAAASKSDWTLQSPVDPGVTLLELYAWLIEQRVFWLDQVPDSMVRASLRLLGIESILTTAARTVMQIGPRSIDPPLSGHLNVGRRAQLRLQNSRPSILFTTTQPAIFLDLGDPAVRVTSRVNGRARMLNASESLPLFAPGPGTAEVRFDFVLRTPPPASFAAPFNILLSLDVAPDINPGWHPTGARTAPAPCMVRWWCSGLGGRRELAAAELVDGTLGLRRSGLVAFRPSVAWTGTPAAAGATYSIWATVDRPVFAYPPRLSAVVPGVVIAEHRRQVTRMGLRLDWLPLPGRELSLALDDRRDLDGDGPMEEGIQLRLRERDGTLRSWHATSDFDFSRADARVFVPDRVRHSLAFGDGYLGRIPNLAPGSNASWRVWMGGGTRGNVGAALSWDSVAEAPAAAWTATNVVPGIGGREPEAIADARVRAAAWTSRITRAVTANDYEALACSTPGVDVARAHAAVGVHPDYLCPVSDAVTVFIVPWAPRDESIPADEFVAAPTADPGMLAAVVTRLERRRLLCTQLFVRPVRYRAVRLHVELDGDALDAQGLTARIAMSLRNLIDPLTGGGGDALPGWPFGAPLRPSMLLENAQEAGGGAVTVRRVAISLDSDQSSEDCHDVDIGAHALPWLESVGVAINPATIVGGLR